MEQSPEFVAQEHGARPPGDNGDPTVSLPSTDVIRAWVLEKPFYRPSRWKPPTIPFLFYESERRMVEDMEDESGVGAVLYTPSGEGGGPNAATVPSFDRQGDATDERHRSKRDAFLEECLAEAAEVLDDDPGGIDCSAGKCEVVVLLLSLALYTTDSACDIFAAGLHLLGGRLAYGALTVLLITAPYFAALARNLIWELHNYRNGDKTSMFELSEIFLIVNYFKSFECAFKSRKNFSPIAEFYKEVDDKRKASRMTRNEYGDSMPIGDKMKYLCRRMGEKYEINNVKFCGIDNLLQTGSQALLQLIYLMNITLLYGKADLGDIFLKFKVGLSIFAFSWTVQRQHYALHFKPRQANDCSPASSLYETMLLVMVHGARTGCFTAWILWNPLSFMVFWPAYLLALYTVSVVLRRLRDSGDPDVPERMKRSYATPWPFYRLFTINPEVMLWSLNSYDHVLFLLETTTPWVVVASIVNEVHLQLTATALILLTLVSFALFYRFGKIHAPKCTPDPSTPR